MKLIVAGSRQFNDKKRVRRELDNYPYITEIVSGGARGPDTVAANYANFHGIRFTLFEPNWDEYGKAAGPIRNKAMAEYGDELLAFWDGKSKGTKNMIEEAMKCCDKVTVIIHE